MAGAFSLVVEEWDIADETDDAFSVGSILNVSKDVNDLKK